MALGPLTVNFCSKQQIAMNFSSRVQVRREVMSILGGPTFEHRELGYQAWLPR